MNCPVCGSGAVVARTCINNYVELAQQGVDPYDLLVNDQAQAECRSCGAVFIPENKPQSKKTTRKKRPAPSAFKG